MAKKDSRAKARNQIFKVGFGLTAPMLLKPGKPKLIIIIPDKSIWQNILLLAEWTGNCSQVLSAEFYFAEWAVFIAC